MTTKQSIEKKIATKEGKLLKLREELNELREELEELAPKYSKSGTLKHHVYRYVLEESVDFMRYDQYHTEDEFSALFSKEVAVEAGTEIYYYDDDGWYDEDECICGETDDWAQKNLKNIVDI